MRLANKVALVTGGGSGIGEAASRLFAEEGAAVAVVDRRREPAEAVAESIRSTGGRAVALAADVGIEDQIKAAIDATATEFGGLHVVFANAGINGVIAPIEEITVDEWQATQQTNMTGCFLTVKHAISHLRAGGGGSIIITASLNGNHIFSNPGYAAYSASKAAQCAFGKMAALELARWGIRVNVLMPGGVKTNIGERSYARNLDKIAYDVKMPEHFPPLHGHFADPREIADVVLFLASDESRYVTGAEFIADAGIRLLKA